MYKTKEEYVNRPDDTDLGWIFNAMRKRQRELDWQRYWFECQADQMQMNSLNNLTNSGLWNALVGASGAVEGWI